MVELGVIAGLEARIEAFRVKIGDLGDVTGFLQPRNEAIEEGASKGVPARMGEYGEDVH